ncbi:MAG TPA: hypothetical protein VMA74_20685 [Dyella sp.]|uniref:hypothetical protein n=1 Tax=Dyella sp. TaxID=1869338 RepID=UPI002B9DC933|nr:hypothetical protein [Dyella sp.]HUB92153.1 hypothetical protein [Dyella sp.]
MPKVTHIGNNRCLTPADFARRLRTLADQIEEKHATDSMLNPKRIILLIESANDGCIHAKVLDDTGLWLREFIGILQWVILDTYCKAPAHD